MGFGGGGEQKSKESPPRSLFHGQDFQLAKRGYSFPPDGRRFLLSSSVRVCVCVCGATPGPPRRLRPLAKRRTYWLS